MLTCKESAHPGRHVHQALVLEVHDGNELVAVLELHRPPNHLGQRQHLPHTTKAEILAALEQNIHRPKE